MEQEKLLSICIPTYNRKERVKSLILEILKNKRDDYEIVVLDNASTDGTYEELKKIKTSKLKLYRREELISGLENGLRVLKLGKAKYSMHFNDRDIVKNYKFLSEILDFLKENDFSFVHFRPSINNKKKFYIFEKGKESKEKITDFSPHPTGLTFRREYLEKLNLNQYLLFEKTDIYPHFFIRYDISIFGKTAIYYTSFWKTANLEFLKNNRSNFLLKLEKPYYFPEERYKQFCKQVRHIINDKFLLDIDSRKKILLNCFKVKFSEATYSYVYYYAGNLEQSCHYGIEPIYLNYKDFRKILRIEKTKYINYLKGSIEKIDCYIYLNIIYIYIILNIKAIKREVLKIIDNNGGR